MEIIDITKRKLVKRVSFGVLLMTTAYTLPRVYKQAKDTAFLFAEIARRARKTMAAILADIDEVIVYYRTGEDKSTRRTTTALPKKKKKE